MSDKSHPFDTYTRHLEQRSRKDKITAPKDRDVRLTERTGVEPERRVSDCGRKTVPSRPYQTPDSALRHTEDDGKSMSSNIGLLSLQLRKITPSDKRAAAEPAPGQSPEVGHPPSHLPQSALYYDAAHLGGGIVPRDRPSPTFQSSLPTNHIPSANPERERFTSSSPPMSPAFTSSGGEATMLLQPETRPITQEQLVNEVKGIYAGLVMVEKKCAEIDQQQSSTTNKLSDEQWQALIALHRTLLHEHHDFFLASQHPSSSPALRRLATKYAMPARMWGHSIHSFLDLLRHQLPDSLDHMLAFVYLAYSMMALLMESVPSFEETWIECLGDLARYRMAIEEADLHDREVWSGVARMWYNKAADKSPNVGRIQHHLAVLARPNIVQQLFRYSKALVSAVPFQNARESVMLLFNPFLEGSEIASQRYPLVESALVKGNSVLFTHSSISNYASAMSQFCSILDNHIGRVTAKFRVQGPEIASSLCAATFDFGNATAFLSQAFHIEEDRWKAYIEAYQSSHGQEEPPPDDSKAKSASMKARWASIDETLAPIRADLHPVTESTPKDVKFSESANPATYRCQCLGETTSVITQRIGDKNILAYMHVVLAYLYGLAFVPTALTHVEGCVPWEDVTVFLSGLARSGVVEARFENPDFLLQMSGTGQQLPEGFVMRGPLWAQQYSPAGLFTGQIVDEDGRNLELLRHTAPRVERYLRNLCPIHDSHGSRCLKWYLYAHIESLLLTRAKGWIQAFVDCICLTFSTFMQHSPGAAKLFLIGSLPVACAAPASDSPKMGDILNPGAWLDFGTTCHILGWAFASVCGGLVYYLGVRGPRKDLARYYVLSFGSAGASLVLLDGRAAPEVRWPALIVGAIFLVRLWAKVSELYEMGYGWLGPILGLGIVIDISLVHLTVSASGGDQGLFLQLLLASICIALSLCALVARCYLRINANSRSDDMV